MLMKRLIIVLLTTMMLTGSMAGCDSSKGLDLSSSTPQSSKAKPTSKIEVMDFNSKLELKKPTEPIPTQPQILFLGNSYIFTNDLPSMFMMLSESGGFDAEVYELSNGGYHLSFFADPEDELGAQALEELTNFEWDYVIMQEQSRLPTFADMVKTEMLPAAEKLSELIKAANGQAVLMMTWAYKDGDDLRDSGINKITTREEMQTEIANSYIDVAKKIDSLLSPAGIAFIRSAKSNPEIELWDAEDNMHPTVEGTYLASCVLYATIYNQSPVGLSFVPEGISADVASILQQTASDVVLG